MSDKSYFLNNTQMTSFNTIVNDYEDVENSSLVKEILLLVYPIGSYYWSNVNTDPSHLFGGTWQRVKDTFIYALGDSGASGDTGGASTHTHTQSSATGSTKLTAAQSGLPSHAHVIKYDGLYPIYGNKASLTDYINDERSVTFHINHTTESSHLSAIAGTAQAASQGHTHTLGSTNSASSLPPYRKAYCWIRIA